MTCTPTVRTAAPLDRLIGLNAQGSTGQIRIAWDHATLYPAQNINFFVRKADISDSFTQVTPVLRDSGAKTITGLEADLEYVVWLRPYNTQYYGQWQFVKIKAGDGQVTGLELVTRVGDTVTFNGDTVVNPTQET